MECYSARPSRSSASGEVVSETLITARRSFRLGGTKGRTGENGCERFSATLAWAYRCVRVLRGQGRDTVRPERTAEIDRLAAGADKRQLRDH